MRSWSFCPRMPEIIFRDQRTIVVDAGESILDTALASGVSIYHTCGGNASCSTCRVIVLKGAENLSPVEQAESEVLDAFDLKPPCRLSCQARILGGAVEVEIPKWERAPRPNKTPQVP